VHDVHPLLPVHVLVVDGQPVLVVVYPDGVLGVQPVHAPGVQQLHEVEEL
jgi:hypothetical protein